MLDIYDKLPDEFRVSPEPDDLVTVWRGDKVGRHVTGIVSRLGHPAAAVEQVRHIVGGGTSAINELIDQHTDADPASPLVSVTNAITRAQGYSQRRDETIYELQLPAHRLIGDPYNIGSPRKSHASEIFVIGAVQPEEIHAYKANNDDWRASELLSYRTIGDRQIAVLADLAMNPGYFHDPAQLPNPAGEWVTND